MKREYWKYMTTIIPYLKRHKLLASASLFLMALGALAALAQPWPLAFVVDSVLGHQKPPQTITHLVGRSPNSLIVFAVSVRVSSGPSKQSDESARGSDASTASARA